VGGAALPTRHSYTTPGDTTAASDDAKAFCRAFVAWYNHACYDVGLTTPDQGHYGQADTIHAARQITLNAAFAAHPERFVKNTHPAAHADRRLDQPAPSQAAEPKLAKKLDQSC